MRAIHFLVAIFAFASAHATDWDELVQDRDTVAIVQQTLRAEGYDPGPINGELGPQTAAALKQAQKDRELEPTGLLDRRTTAALGIDAESAAAGGSDRLAQGGELRGSCDELLGPEKAGCLKQGGTIETRAAR
jgi:peptidoglycan hydrolase-like protein with peptidoglycan-binding domain